MKNVGLLLLNLGTPDSPDTTAVSRYLREFLSDPRVIDIPPLARFFLVNALIIPFRAPKSAAAYRKIWTSRGSPLAYHTADLTKKVQSLVGPNIAVRHAMRYQNPSLASALSGFKAAGVNHIVLAPLFPQYSSAAWGSAVERFFTLLKDEWNVPSVSVLPPFFEDSRFIQCVADKAKAVLNSQPSDHILFSFHGLPERHCTKTDLSTDGHCFKRPDCCVSRRSVNHYCYRSQCERTAELIAGNLKLDRASWSICFQSRLGRTPWIKPYTDVVIDDLAAKGVKRIVLVSPSFVADCLETVEEITIRANEQFRAKGGQEVTLVPSLNSDDAWAEALVSMCKPLFV